MAEAAVALAATAETGEGRVGEMGFIKKRFSTNEKGFGQQSVEAW